MIQSSLNSGDLLLGQNFFNRDKDFAKNSLGHKKRFLGKADRRAAIKGC